MKPDGVATVQSEPMEAEGTEPVTEATSSDGASRNGTTQSPPQPDEPQNEQVAPPKVKEASGKAVDAKSKSKGPIKGKTTAAAPATTGPGTRPKATQSRLATNGLTKTTASTLTKKPIPATNAAADKKKPTTTSGPSGVTKKPVGSSTVVATSRPQPKVTTVGTSRSTTTTTTTAAGTKTGAVVGTASSLSRRPATAATSAATKPKSTAPRPATAPAAKPSTSATAKTTAAPKTNRSTVNSAPRPAATSTSTGRATTTTTTAVTKTSRTATQQPVKPLVSASAARKDVGKTSTTAPGKKTVAPTLSRPAPSKSLNSDAPKSAAALKRPPPATKAPQLKPDDKKSVPTRKVPPSPRNNPSRPASGKNTAASPSHKQAGSGSGKLQPSKPTQSVLPLVKGKPNNKETAAKPDNEELATDPVQLSAVAVATVAVATAAAMAREEFSSEPETTPATESSLHAPTASLDVEENVDLQLPNVSHQNVQDVPATGPETEEILLETDLVKEVDLKSSVVSQESEEQMSRKADEKLIAAVAPVSQEVPEQETTVSPFDISAAAVVPSGVEVVEKAEPTNGECFEDVEEEEREGSQQVSLSEMSGTQPTEESRPGSAGLAGSVWRAGALLSELDSEDVSCSQQGASELSAPGVLEGTESMDDLGDASLKGADGEGASVGSPDFEKVPDILNNEDDDDDEDEDRVCDMEVGSERAEDSHRQLHDNDEDDDEDVEMASEGITESGLESYGNADEDDLTEDYRLDNLNRIQPPIIPSAPLATQWNQPSCFADAWAQPPQPASTLLTSPSSECWQADPETPTEKPAQSRIDVCSEAGSSSPLPSNLFEPPPCSTQLATLTGAEGDSGPKPGLTPSQTSEFHADMPSKPELASETNRDAVRSEKVEDHNNSGIGTNSKEELQQEPLNPVPTVLPDIMQDLGIHLECADEEQPETMPAEDVLGGPATAQSSSSSATEDEASDTEGEMQISDPQAELPGIESAFGIAPVGQNLSTLEEHDEVGGENEVGGGGGSETPQSATSAASYGFDYMTSNSNAQSSAESCSKSPGIFSLENEEQLPDEAKDPSLLEELTLIPATGSGEKIDPVKCQHGEFQANPENQYMLCGESSELPESNSVVGTVPVKSDLTDPSPQNLEEEQDPETQHPYYSTICEKTDSPLAERNFPPQPNDLLSIQMTMSSKLRLRPRASHVPQAPRLPTDLPPRIPNAVSNTQLRCLEQHQQHLHEIQQRQEKRSREQERQAKEEMQVRKGKQEEEEEEEEQRRNLLELKLKQQEQELKQRQQIMQWQQELEEQQQQQQKHKVQTPVILSPSTGLTTIYETLETSDSEDGEEEGKQSVVEELQDKSSFIVFPGEDTQRCTDKNVSANPYTTPSPESATQDSQQELKETDTATDQDSPSLGSPERPPPLEFDWGKKVDIVQQLINQTLLLTGDGCSPLLLLPGRAGGTLSPLESSMWPNLLPPLTPPSATVTSVSSFSPEAPGSSAQGEWTVVELETHH